MRAATMTSKGQITIPKEVRDDLGLRPGTRVAFVKNEDGRYELRRDRRPVRELAGALRYTGPAKSIEQMDDAIATAAAESMR